jgi:hypothetical protein
MKAAKLFLCGVLILAATACRREEDVTSHSSYTGIVGHVFETKGDFILFKFSERDKEVQVEEPGTTDIPELSGLPSKYPYEYRGNIIMGVFPKGSRFQVFAVKSVHGSVGGIYYKAHVLEPTRFKGMEIDPTWLAPGGGFVPKFDPKLVEEVKPTAGK